MDKKVSDIISVENSSTGDLQKTPKLKDPQKNPLTHSMWDAFEHILLFISLYVFVTSFALLVHYLVDKWIPRFPEGRPVSYSSVGNSVLRGYLSAILVSYPLFSFFFLRITKRTLVNPELRKIRPRKTLIYLTLVVTFIVSLINIISIVYSFLGGNVTANFFAHFFVTFLISGIIFAYYLFQVREDRSYA